MIALESADSIRFLYQHFLSGITEKSLNAFYYACSYAKVDYSGFMNVTASMALKLIPKSLIPQPVFLCIDDTMVSKFGKKFEHVSKLFDHAAHNGSNYLNGHCFVSIMLCVPVWKHNTCVYMSIPLGYRIWQKDISKLDLAADMVLFVTLPTPNYQKILQIKRRYSIIHSDTKYIRLFYPVPSYVIIAKLLTTKEAGTSPTKVWFPAPLNIGLPMYTQNDDNLICRRKQYLDSIFL